MQSLTEFSWPDIRRICGADNADSPEMWREKSRTTLTLASYFTSEDTYEFLDERWAAELGDAVAPERKIRADIDGGPATSAAYQAAEIERQQQLVDEGDFLTLNNRNRLEQVLVCMCVCHQEKTCDVITPH